MGRIELVMLVASLVCFILASVGVGHPKVNLIAVGLALWVATVIF